MAKIKPVSYIKEIHGRSGNYIYYCVKGRQYARSYTKPRNPGTETQQANRASFAEAVKMWQGLSHAEKEKYNRRAGRNPYSGYNLFISMQVKGLINKKLNMLRISRAYVYAKHMRRINSVIPSLLSADYSIYIPGNTGGNKKPPGIIVPAA